MKKTESMRKYLFLVMILGFAAQAFGQETKSTEKKDGPVITFDKRTHDFGDVIEGDKPEHTYHFTNTGNEPLILTNVQVQCGCTTPKGWAREPIPPGGKGEITVSFNSTGRRGKNNKTVTVVSNASNAEGNLLSFTVNVLEKGTQPQ